MHDAISITDTVTRAHGELEERVNTSSHLL